MLRRLVLLVVAHSHLRHLHFEAVLGIQGDGFLHVPDQAVLQAAGLFAVAAQVALHPDAVDQPAELAVVVLRVPVDAPGQFDGRGPLLLLEQVIVVVEQADVRAELLHGVPGAEEGILDVVLADGLQELVRLAAAGRAQPARVPGQAFRVAVADGFVHHVPAVDDPGELFLEMGHDLVDVAFQAFAHRFPVRQRPELIVSLMEEPGGHVGVPHQHVTADADPVLLRPGDHFVRLHVVHAGHPVVVRLADGLVQQGIGLRFVGAGQGIEVRRHQVQVGRLLEVVIAEAAAEPEAVWFGQLVHGFVIGRGGSRFLSQGEDGEQAEGQRKRGAQDAVHESVPFHFRFLRHGSSGLPVRKTGAG